LLFLLVSVDPAVASKFIARWNRTINNWNNGILTIEDLPSGASDEDKDFIQFDSFNEKYQKLLQDNQATIDEGYSSIGTAYATAVNRFQEASVI
jgi:hypothetical protein